MRKTGKYGRYSQIPPEIPPGDLETKYDTCSKYGSGSGRCSGVHVWSDARAARGASLLPTTLEGPSRRAPSSKLDDYGLQSRSANSHLTNLFVNLFVVTCLLQ